MAVNRLKALWRADRAAINGWLSIGDGLSAEIMARLGWDACTVDLQHGTAGYQQMLGCLQAIGQTQAVPLVRVSWNEPGAIMRALDAGALGIICPMVDDAEQAAHLARWCRYPPRGRRSMGPIRAGIAHDNYVARANDQIVVMPMIETAEGLANVEAIAAVPGIDALYVGPSDLSFTMGLKPHLDSQDPRVLKAFDRIIAAGRKHNVAVGGHALTAKYALSMIKRGFRFVSVANDAGFLAEGAGACVAALRAGLKR